ncbi:cell division protein FtsW [Segetibacter sp. 3557_3]|uniref:FtsW/RodA/SpoVE family cell cycle protein n=1 Tax=Segetibacter sp. 3557_3 TaxID=2547429 RepID=UPI00105871B5|nr:FtsW/RodA/SpoVE family cell cycle protein [Segetibacter sp. 3557_3]TDH22987.1 cell division protein FtsW [Segetibacter sp. 3557_3]
MSDLKDIKFSDMPAMETFGSGLLKRTKGDRYIWGIVILLAVTSLLVVYSATGSLAYKMYKGNNEVYLFKQFAFIVTGIIVIYFAHRINYTLYSRIALYLFLASIPLLIFTFFFGARINEGSRWIMLPVIRMTIQTSDLAKLALFMYLARQLSRTQDVIKDFRKGFVPLIVPVGIICALIAPANLSTALLVGATSLILMFIGRVNTKHILATIGIAMIPLLVLVLVAVATYTDKADTMDGRNTGVAEQVKSVGRVGTWIKRVQDFIYAKEDETPYQVQQSKIAIAKGGVFGMGPGNSQQRNFLPHPYSDFIYAIIIEEYGLMGGGVIIFIYLVFLLRCISIFRRCPFAFGAFLAMGLSFTLVIQAMANMAVTVNLVPVTGVTLPLVSMGGSSFLFTCAAIGIILSVASNVEKLESPVAIAQEDEGKKEDGEETPAIA